MNNKIQSEIIRINLNDASYKNTNSTIEPTYVNFFFGNNGTGKSTIAKAIQSGNGVSYIGGKSSEDYLPLVYNQEFINENFQSYRGMKGVFTLNAKNTEIQKQIDGLINERDIIKNKLTQATKAVEQKKTEAGKLLDNFNKACWTKEKQFRKDFSKTLVGKRKTDLFADEILKHKPYDYDMNEFKRLYDSAFSDEATRYHRFIDLVNTSILDNFEGSEILSVSIVNSADTKLAKILREIGSTEWMHQGHEEFKETSNGYCPYCGRKLDDNFEETVIRSFDSKYQDNISKLDHFLEAYIKAANELYDSLRYIPEKLYPQIDIQPYNDKLEVLYAVIQENINRIEEKIDSPSSIVTLESVESILKEISDLISGYNNLIDENNAVIDALPKKKKECINLAFSILAYRLKDEIKIYKENNKAIYNEYNKLQADIKDYDKNLETIDSTLKNLQKQTVETDSAKNSINQMLHDSGMQGFSLVPKENVEHVYEVRRPNGEIADNLSEGEKNFIAFLYFYHLVQGSVFEDGDNREKIVVIDDPVSSMDSGCLFIVSTLVRRMIEICRNNADNRNKTVDGNFIKQIFILTHNAYFHREITHGYITKYEYVSFYLIRKQDSKSSVKLCDDVNPLVPTERVNINPVKNSYAALWDEYKELKSATPLMNVIRRILEYYFLQLCGYDGSTLRERILIDGKANGKFNNEDGSENLERYQMASAMLSYISTSSVGINDGIDFVEYTLNADECKKVFKIIFECMGQEQHYNMMMNR